MADVKWIKIVTNIFNNKKITLIEAMPDADAILVIWFKLLCLAGNINENGLIVLTKDIAYTDEMLSTQFRKPLNTIRLALNTFEHFGMIELVDNVYCISNWEKYQNIDKLNALREYNRIAKQKERSRKKELPEGVNDMSMTSQRCQYTDIDIDKDIEVDKERDKKNISNGFDLFWKFYPKKVSKDAAKKAWKKLNIDDALLHTILTAIENMIKHRQRLLDKKEFAPEYPYPATWLNGKRWEDELSDNSSGTNSSSDEGGTDERKLGTWL